MRWLGLGPMRGLGRLTGFVGRLRASQMPTYPKFVALLRAHRMEELLLS